MADNSSSGEKTESATPKKRKDARERGNVLKSNEIVACGSLLIIFAALKALFSTLSKNVMVFSTEYFNGTRMLALSSETVLPVMQDVALNFLMMVLPILLVAMGVGIALNVVQVGFAFNTKAMELKMERLNPIEGFKRMFSGRTMFELLKTTIKVAIVCFVIYSEIVANETTFVMLISSGLKTAVASLGTIILNAAIKACGALMAVAVMDYFFQWRKFEKDLKMTKYEVKMEYKQQEGDPQIKSQIRQKQRQMAMMRMMQNVPEADVVITNPTHYAVALIYKEKDASAPKVVAKGKDLIAQKIKEIAKENGVEIVENQPLAQSLYFNCEIGDLIPVALYQAVAEILAQVYKQKHKEDRYRKR